MTERTIFAPLLAVSLASGCVGKDPPKDPPPVPAPQSEPTAWDDLGLVGRVRRLETRRIRDGAEPEIQIIEFTHFGQKSRVNHGRADWFSATLDDRGRVIEGTTALGRLEVLEFDARDRRRVWRDVHRPTRPHREETSETTSLELDAMGRISRKTVVRTDPPGPERTVLTEFTYDDDGDWKTTTEYGTTRERKVMEYGGPNKRVVSRLEGGMLTEVIHRPSGRVLSELGAGRSAKREYESFDDRGNWLTMVMDSASFGSPTNIRVTRTIEYYAD